MTQTPTLKSIHRQTQENKGKQVKHYCRRMSANHRRRRKEKKKKKKKEKRNQIKHAGRKQNPWDATGLGAWKRLFLFFFFLSILFGRESIRS